LQGVDFFVFIDEPDLEMSLGCVASPRLRPKSTPPALYRRKTIAAGTTVEEIGCAAGLWDSLPEFVPFPELEEKTVVLAVLAP